MVAFVRAMAAHRPRYINQKLRNSPVTHNKTEPRHPCSGRSLGDDMGDDEKTPEKLFKPSPDAFGRKHITPIGSGQRKTGWIDAEGYI